MIKLVREGHQQFGVTVIKIIKERISIQTREDNLQLGFYCKRSILVEGVVDVVVVSLLFASFFSLNLNKHWHIIN